MARIPKQRKLPNPRWGGLHHPGIDEKVQRALDEKHEQDAKHEQEQNKEAEAVAEEEKEE